MNGQIIVQPINDDSLGFIVTMGNEAELFNCNVSRSAVGNLKHKGVRDAFTSTNDSPDADSNLVSSKTPRKEYVDDKIDNGGNNVAHCHEIIAGKCSPSRKTLLENHHHCARGLDVFNGFGHCACLDLGLIGECDLLMTIRNLSEEVNDMLGLDGIVDVLRDNALLLDNIAVPQGRNDDADQFAVVVDERTTGIAGLDGCVNLILQVFVLYAVQTTDDTFRHLGRESLDVGHGESDRKNVLAQCRRGQLSERER